MRGRVTNYTPQELDLFAQYRDTRAKRRPQQCKRSGMCWVELGPPAYKKYPEDNNSCCVECKGVPDMRGKG